MELCCPPRVLLSFSRARPSPLFPSLHSLKVLHSVSKGGLHYPRAASSEETSTTVSQKLEQPLLLKKPEESASEPFSVEASSEVGEEGEDGDFLSKLNVKLELDDYSIIAYGAGALLALWISSAVVGAIDSLPLIPKVMEVVGFGYSVWFIYRYLIFKQNREELFAKIEDVKQQIIGPLDGE